MLRINYEKFDCLFRNKVSDDLLEAYHHVNLGLMVDTF